MAVQGHSPRDPSPTDVVTEGLQPFLHDTCTTLYAPSLALSRPDGDMAEGADGFFHGDRRALSTLRVVVEGVPLAPVGRTLLAADRTAFRSILRGVGEHTADPAVTLRRVRSVTPGALREELEIVNAGVRHLSLTLALHAGTDLASMGDVKAGRGRPCLEARAEGGGLLWETEGVTVALTAVPVAGARETDSAPETAPTTDLIGGGVGAGSVRAAGGAAAVRDEAAARTTRVEALPDAVRVAAEPDAVRVAAAEGVLRHTVDLPPGGTWRAAFSCVVTETEGDGFAAVAPGAVSWSRTELRSADRRFDRLLTRSLGDLERLLLSDGEHPDDRFLAAGSPWFLTLFGRDALWAARMLLPLGTDLAAGTLRVLARRQGRRVDPETEEQPGKILHEVRRETVGGSLLPPVYYGTVDATPLWVILLHDAWRWGLDPQEVRALLPHAEAALEWLASYGDADGDGLLEYIDTTGRGLANQGWKDSGDSIRWQDGRLARAPIALCEVQAYGYEAAVAGARLLRAFGRPGAERWEQWAGRLRDRFRESFWTEDATGRFPAVALDADKRPVDSVTSGFGHLLGTGLLDDEESALLAARLAGPRLDSGFGLRTLSTDSVGFNPFGYHIGSVWPHDTAIAVHGLVRAGFPEEAASLARGLVAASEVFEGRLPELFAGHGTAHDGAPAPYPAACRPQAWSAASAVMLLTAALGLDVDVPAGTLRLDARGAAGVGPLDLTGLRVAGAPLAVHVDASGRVRVDAPDELTVHGADRSGPHPGATS
ncbi:glycogen debranching N-terminal domain-containing protein [Streptomyces sp. NBC_01497]|uniref:glycogen debranching N-terminal domain-containing protein n=1 Tax=Streptomyces sp. NBC_01497 TaxID=2903885 RepID=UPI002E3191C7|nr:glycogen debranching N-terminal domain-containing protein [Streptomyces sp. NBC_01497]